MWNNELRFLTNHVCHVTHPLNCIVTVSMFTSVCHISYVSYLEIFQSGLRLFIYYMYEPIYYNTSMFHVINKWTAIGYCMSHNGCFSLWFKQASPVGPGITPCRPFLWPEPSCPHEFVLSSLGLMRNTKFWAPLPLLLPDSVFVFEIIHQNSRCYV